MLARGWGAQSPPGLGLRLQQAAGPQRTCVSSGKPPHSQRGAGDVPPRNNSCLWTVLPTLRPGACPSSALGSIGETGPAGGMAEAAETAEGVGPARVLQGGP